MLPEFSETQFVFGYLRELFSHDRPFRPWGHFLFPTLPAERRIPVDFLIDFYSHSEFYQFKISEYRSLRRGAREIQANVPATFLPYYRFKIYNRVTATSQGQFELLRALASSNPEDVVYYCAPGFHTEWDYHQFFNAETIMNNSVLIDCAQFNHASFLPPNFDINDGEKHSIVYKPGNTQGYICSEAKEIKVKFSKGNEEYRSRPERGKDLKETIKRLYFDFYLKDDFKISGKKKTSDSTSQQYYIVSNYLLQYYNTFWIPRTIWP